MADLSDVIQQYLADREAKGYSVSTLRGDKRTLQLLLADTGNINSRHLKNRHIDKFWLNRSQKNKWSSGTMNLAKDQLSSFLSWCESRNHIPRNSDLLAEMKRLKVKPRKRVIIPQAEFETFIAGALTERNRAMLALGLYQFLRIGEVSCLRWQDVDLEDGVAEVTREKTLSEDTLPICSELADHLKQWKREYGIQAGQQVRNDWYIVPALIPPRFIGPGIQGEVTIVPTQRARLEQHVNQELVRGGYYQKFEGGHTLRRSGATALYNRLKDQGHDRAMRVVQAMLGHANIATTEIYLRLDIDRKVRDDLLAGTPMFGADEEGDVIEMRDAR